MEEERKIFVAFSERCDTMKLPFKWRCTYTWLTRSVTLASAAVPALMPAPWVRSPRALPSTRSMPALAWIAAAALTPAPWALSLRSNLRNENHPAEMSRVAKDSYVL